MSTHWAWLRWFWWLWSRTITFSSASWFWFLIASTWIVSADWAERITVPLWVLEVLGCPHKVIERKEILSVEQSCSTAQYLLKLHHVVYGTKQYDVSHVSCIYTSWQLLWCCQDGGTQIVVILEQLQLLFSFCSIVGSHSLAIVWVWHLFPPVYHCHNLMGVFLCGTEHQGFLVWVYLP